MVPKRWSREGCSSLGARKGVEKSSVGRRGGGGNEEVDRQSRKEEEKGDRGGEGDVLRYSKNVKRLDGLL